VTFKEGLLSASVILLHDIATVVIPISGFNRYIPFKVFIYLLRNYLPYRINRSRSCDESHRLVYFRFSYYYLIILTTNTHRKVSRKGRIYREALTINSWLLVDLRMMDHVLEIRDTTWAPVKVPCLSREPFDGLAFDSYQCSE
jgi:hypothetical protein